MLGRYSVYAANFLSMIGLARIFTPDTFGIVAAIAVFLVFFQLMAEAGLGPAVINLAKLVPEDRDGLFGLTLAIGLILAALFSTLAPLFLLFYGLPRVDEVVLYVALSLLFFAAGIVPNAFLLREQKFFNLANAGLAAEISSTSIVIGLAQLIDPLHALAAKSVVSAVTTFFMVWYFSADTEFGRPIPGLKFSAIKSLLRFSSYQFGFNFINYFSRNLDNILVGKCFGANALGVYDKAYQLMKYPLTLLTFAMTPAIQPVLRKCSGDPVQIESIHHAFILKLSIVGAIVGLLVFLFADHIVFIVLGSQWQDVVPIIRILAIAIPVQVVLSSSGSFFQAMNRSDALFLSGFLSAIVMIFAISIGIISQDIKFLCWNLVVAFHINFLQAYYLLYKFVFRTGFKLFFIKMAPVTSVILGSLLFFAYFK